MKTTRLWRLRSIIFCSSLLVSSLLQTFHLQAQQLTQPVITSVQAQSSNLLVRVQVPEGIRRVTLESRLRLDAVAWTPVAVRQTDGVTRALEFSVPANEKFQLLRVRADFRQPLPQTFYTGKSAFGGPPTNSVPPGGFNDATTGGPGREGGDSSGRQVAESDIWKINGDRLYFFNQFRGLQVLDIANPDEPKVLGTLPIPAAGEQMYLADDDHVVLLAREGCYYGDTSQVMIVGVTNGEPSLLKKLSVKGYIQESRMVGSALYVASQTYRAVTGTSNTVWEWGSVVSSYDLADPTAPVARTELWFPGYGQAISATDTFLFVVTQDPSNWGQSEVRIIDITNPNGEMSEYVNVRTAGLIADKFKLDYTDGVFTTISETWGSRAVVTRLETFRLEDPRSVPPFKIQKLGSLELGDGERLHATRFDGTKVYVVTFFQIDPLWVVDLSDPTQPRISGSVEIPGWSTYIKPLGSRLVSVGVETNRVAVSLFDVSDPAKPGLLSRVLLGQNYSWTEANYDEKAFSVLEEPNLILVPYSGDTTNGWTSRVQLIDLLPDKLVARGKIDHEFQPRRATFAQDRVLSLSGSSLLSVNVENRDEPKVTAEATLAWSVDRVFVKDDFLIQIGSGNNNWWGDQGGSSLSVSSRGEPDELLGSLDLGKFDIVGATLEEDRLYVAQARNDWWWYPPEDQDTNAPNFMMTVVDVSALPAVAILGQSTNRVVNQGWWGGAWQAVWPKPGFVVWAGGGGGWWLYGRGPMIDFGGLWPGWYSGGGQLLCFDVTADSLPELVSEVNLQTNSWWDFSSPFVNDALVYLSHTTSGEDPSGGWVQQSFLDVIDYEDPATPTVRKPVNIPAKLAGLSHQGELVYTKGVHWATNQTDWKEWIDASAYDGVSAHLVASLPLPETWPHPVIFEGDNILLGRSVYENPGTGSGTHYVETWVLGMDGEFKKTGSLEVSSPVNIMVKRGDLLATQDYSATLSLLNATDLNNLVPLTQFTVPGCIWVNLESSEGSPSEGLWVPLGMYGVLHVPVGGL